MGYQHPSFAWVVAGKLKEGTVIISTRCSGLAAFSNQSIQACPA
jgi:hypothetical protein